MFRKRNSVIYLLGRPCQNRNGRRSEPQISILSGDAVPVCNILPGTVLYIDFPFYQDLSDAGQASGRIAFREADADGIACHKLSGKNRHTVACHDLCRIAAVDNRFADRTYH